MGRRFAGAAQMADPTKQTAAYWSQQSSTEQMAGAYWLELPATQQRLSAKISGDPAVDGVLYTVQRHLAGRLPLSRCLSLGCGEGRLERRMAQLGVFEQCDAVDIADGSIAAARNAALAAGYTHINYEVADANTLALPASTYDAIWGTGSIHHIEKLEHLFGQVANSLTPDGIFVLDEYVGASRFQFPLRQREILQACHALLPERYRVLSAAVSHNRGVLGRDGWRWRLRRLGDKLLDGDLIGAARRHSLRLWDRRRGRATVRQGVDLPTAQSVVAIDPSEAIRSADIIPVLTRYFDIVELRPMGGSILQFLLADIAGNFRSEEGQRLLEMLFAIEDTLMATGDLGSDFVYIVARPKAQTQ